MRRSHWTGDNLPDFLLEFRFLRHRDITPLANAGAGTVYRTGIIGTEVGKVP